MEEVTLQLLRPPVWSRFQAGPLRGAHRPSLGALRTKAGLASVAPSLFLPSGSPTNSLPVRANPPRRLLAGLLLLICSKRPPLAAQCPGARRLAPGYERGARFFPFPEPAGIFCWWPDSCPRVGRLPGLATEAVCGGEGLAAGRGPRGQGPVRPCPPAPRGPGRDRRVCDSGHPPSPGTPRVCSLSNFPRGERPFG